jgi:hypothetical protein
LWSYRRGSTDADLVVVMLMMEAVVVMMAGMTM